MFKCDTATKAQTVEVTLDGRPVSLPTGMSVAAALLASGETIFRISPSSGRLCAPYCLMGVCFECVLEIDGVQRQACLTEIHAGMVINRNLDDGKDGHKEEVI